MDTFSGYYEGVQVQYPFSTEGYLVVPKCYNFGEHDKLIPIDYKKFIPKKHTTNLKDVNIPKYYTKSFCKLLGYFIANGSYGTNSVNFSTNNKDIAEDYCSLVEEVFGIVPIRSECKNKVSSYVISSVIVKDFLVRSIFKGKHTARFKIVPKGVMESNKECISSFLIGLFDCDSYIERDRNFIFNTASESVARFVHIVLLGFGVVSNLRPFNGVKGYEDHTYWDVRLSGKYFYKLVEDLFLGESLIYTKKVKKLKVNTNFDFIPNMSVWLLTEIGCIRETLGVKPNGMYKVNGKTYRFKIMNGINVEKRKNMTYETLENVLEYWETLPADQRKLVERLEIVIKKVLVNSYYFDKIKYEENF